MKKKQDKLNRWEDFRERRKVAIDRYICAMKHKIIMELWIKDLTLNVYIQASWRMLQQEKEYREILKKKALIAVKLTSRGALMFRNQGGIKKMH